MNYQILFLLILAVAMLAFNRWDFEMNVNVVATIIGTNILNRMHGSGNLKCGRSDFIAGLVFTILKARQSRALSCPVFELNKQFVIFFLRAGRTGTGRRLYHLYSFARFPSGRSCPSCHWALC